MNTPGNIKKVSGRHLATLCLLLISIAGCIEIIDFDVNREGRRLVVDGTISDKNGSQTLRLRYTAEEEKITDPLTGADVYLYDDLGNSEPYFETEDGVYKMFGDIITGTPGRSYHIEITLPGGAEYHSEPETIPASIARDSIYYEFDTITEAGTGTETNIIRVFRDTSIPETDNPLYLRWELKEVYKFTQFDFPDPMNNPPPTCYVTHYDDPQNILLFNGREINETTINKETIAEREVDDTFFQRHYFNLIQFSISQKAHEYWSQVDEVVNSRGTIFDPPPATVESNIYNVDNPDEKILGYFEAARVDTARFFLVNDMIPFFVGNPCGSTYRDECLDCDTIGNTTPEPPFYWLDD